MEYDFCGWATVHDKKCTDGRVIKPGAFKHCDGAEVPLVWNHQHNSPENILGKALLHHMDKGVYAYCSFNSTESGQMAKELVEHGDVRSLSIHANQLKQQGCDVLHGAIREVSLVLAGANPDARIESIIKHDDGSDEEAYIFMGEDIMLAHSEDETDEEEKESEKVGDETNDELAHADENKEEKKVSEEVNKTEEKVEEKTEEMTHAEEKKAEDSKEKTVKDVFDEFTEEQKTVVYALIGQALEDAGVSDEGEDEDEDEDKEVKHSEGGNYTMNHNIFENEEQVQSNFLSHADQQEIIEMAKSPTVGSLKMAMAMYAEKHSDTLSHGIDDIDQLFPDYKDVHPGAPELLERDRSWIGHVMSKAHKSPVSRVRTRQLDARAKELRAKGYNNRAEEKALSGNLKLLARETNPQTVYYKDALHRDDITDITDFDVVAYQRNVMKRGLEEEIALAALVGDGREVTDPDKIGEDHIRPIWKDADLYTIKAPVDIAAMTEKLQGTDTGKHFGEEFIFTESVIKALLDARIKYKGKGPMDFFCAPQTLNKMLLARDFNGRRIYDNEGDIAKALNVANIFTVEQFVDLAPREDEEGNKFNLLGLFVNMGAYQFGSTKGGEITSFEDFDIDFNSFKYLIEARLSGALTEVYSAIALEEPVVEAAG